MKTIESTAIPPANGHYSQCIEHGGLLYISGQLPLLEGSKLMPESIEEQTALVLRKIELILNEAGSSRQKVIQMRIYISGIELWDQVDGIYSRFFENHKPVRCIVPVGKLHYGCLIEAEAIARV